ncbi:MAG: sulfatase-like hydrolase/transferase [Armatimonadota bacterium]
MNVLLIMVDEMDGRKMGCAGWEGLGQGHIHTPNLDALAERGVIFEDTYCGSPLCVPSRASFVTGRHVHDIHCWDNGAPFNESWATFGHRLEQQGVPVTAHGKMHFVEPFDDHGFQRTFEADRRKSIVDICGLFRDPLCRREGARERLRRAGPKDISGNVDERVFERSVEFLRSSEAQDGPWMLWSSFRHPHFPHFVPEQYYDLYPESEVEFPPVGDISRLNQLNRDLRYHFEVEELVDEETWIRNVRGYHGLISYVDDFVGGLMDTLDDQGLADDTIVIFTSDHGEMLGSHGMWWKCAPFEPSVRVPLIIAGPDVRPGERVERPVGQVNLFPTIVDAAGCELTEDDEDLPGVSLLPLARDGDDDDLPKVVLSQYHGHGVRNGWFMVRRDEHKLIHYHGFGHEMYNVSEDPDELDDLTRDPDSHHKLASLDGMLHDLLDPDVVDTTAKADQAARRDRLRDTLGDEEFDATVASKCAFDVDEG